MFLNQNKIILASVVDSKHIQKPLPTRRMHLFRFKTTQYNTHKNLQ